jgi:iron complex outermembrane receptor protein
VTQTFRWVTGTLTIAALFGLMGIQPLCAQPRDFNVPAQSATTGIPEFARQAGIQILVSEPLVRGRRIAAVTGSLTIEEALRQLLKGTGLIATTKDGATYTLAPPTTTSLNSTHLPTATASAQETISGEPSQATQDSDNKGLEEVVVTGHYQFLSADTSGTTNLPIPIEQVPQSISLVSNDFIEAADLKTLGEIAEYTPGAVNVGNQEGLGSAIKLRGFNPGFAVDGINVITNATYYEPDYAIFDRLEVVEGPSSVVYGVSSPGGLVNFVTKSATSQTPDYVYAQAGSWHSFRVEAQAASALDPDEHVRAIGVVVQDQGDSFIDQLYHKKTTLYGGVNLSLSDFTGYLHGGYERFERTSFDGIPTESDGTPAPLPRSFCICAESIGMTTDVYHAEGELTWHATDMLDVMLKGNYQRLHLTGAEDYSFGLQTNGDIGIQAQRDPGSVAQNYGIGLSAIYRFDELGLKNSFASLAALYQNSSIDGTYLFPPGYNTGTTNVFLGQAALSEALEALLATVNTPYTQLLKADTITLSGQSIVQLIPKLNLLLGLSYSKPDQSEVTNGSGQSFNIGGRDSYRVGLTYEFLPKTNAYFSYSESFEPQLLLTTSNTVLPPISGDQYEIGIKSRTANGQLLLTAALFEINEKNVGEYATTINGIDFYQAVGDVRNKGVELQALGRITPQWQVNVAYSYLDPIITGAISSGASPQYATIGQESLYLPKQTTSLYSTYSFDQGSLRGFSAGIGVRYVGAERTSYASGLANVQTGLTPTRDIPGYSVVDGSLNYAIGKWMLQFNAHNILDRRYLINNYQTLYYGNLPGNPTNFALSVRHTF